MNIHVHIFTYLSHLSLCVHMYHSCIYVYINTHLHIHVHTYIHSFTHVYLLGTLMRWLRLVGSLKLYVSFAKEPYKIEDILQKKPIILRSLLIVASPYRCVYTYRCIHIYYSCMRVCMRFCVRVHIGLCI